MKVHWTKNAIEHLIKIHEYIAANSPAYAKRMVDKITKRSTQIADFPYSGREVPEYKAEHIRKAHQSTLPDYLQNKVRSN